MIGFGGFGDFGLDTVSGSYGAPSSGYGAPSSSYGAPSSSYGAPSSSYGSPAPSYSAPSSGYSSPSSSFTNTNTIANGGAKVQDLYYLNSATVGDDIGNIDLTNFNELTPSQQDYIARLLTINAGNTNNNAGLAVQYPNYNPYLASNSNQYQKRK